MKGNSTVYEAFKAAYPAYGGLESDFHSSCAFLQAVWDRFQATKVLPEEFDAFIITYWQCYRPAFEEKLETDKLAEMMSPLQAWVLLYKPMSAIYNKGILNLESLAKAKFDGNDVLWEEVWKEIPSRR